LSFKSERAVKAAWFGWALLFIATAAIILVVGNTRSVVGNYRVAGIAWLDGNGLYDLSGVGGFTYLPQAAILFIPFSLLPEITGEVVWRAVNIAVFVLGIRSFTRLAAARTVRDLFPLVTLVALPLAWDCARNGQATLIMTGLMLLAVVDLARERWWRSALWLSLSVAVKPIAIVLPLLVMALDRPMAWRVPAALAVLALLPFAAQHPTYVLEQYAGFQQNTVTAAHVGAVDKGWTTPFNALQLVGVPVPERVQNGIRLAAAAGTLALCAIAHRRRDASAMGVYLYALAATYLMLFSPRTENNTYAMLGPAIGAFCAWVVLIERRLALGALLWAISLLLLGSRQIQRLVTPQADTSWLPPLMALCFAGYVIVRLFSGRAVRPGVDGPGTKAVAL
jgi:alpha-1,2-mannosyltransferase